MRKIEEGDTVTLSSEGARVDGDRITLWLSACEYPITIRADAVDSVERKQPRKPLRD